ncbi:MAG: PQQ-binding-like beta-propeller repeat protein [Bryobacteraceae bacterium]
MTVSCSLLSTALVALSVQAATEQPPPYTTWQDYSGSADSMQYSALKQINKGNVNKLQLAWFLPAQGPTGRFSFNPLVVNGVMYVIGKDNAVYAVDAASGKQIWTHPVEGHPTNRGFNLWQSEDQADQRLILTVDQYIQEINLKTGVTINTFGNDGKVDLREGLGRDLSTFREIQSGTPGRVFDDLLIMGSAPGEMYGSPPGDIRAYDVKTGQIRWQFHTIPHPGEPGYDTWPPDAWTYVGGVNTWGELSVDAKRGIVYLPLGSPTYDLYGADRKGMGLYGDSLVALDARTGKKLWHFQFVHHDLWDYDPTAAPKLLTVKHNGKRVDVVAQATKFGFLYVFNRVTGEPLWPIEERPVAKSDMPLEESWPTQPFATWPPPFARQNFTLKDINPYLDPKEKARIEDIVKNARAEGIFTPPAFDRDQIAVPGENGGANQGSTAADPTTGMMYVKSYDAPTIHKMTERPRQQPRPLGVGTPEQQGYAVYQRNCIGCHTQSRDRITFPNQIGRDDFVRTLRNGKNQMPAFSEDSLGRTDVDFLAAYLTKPAEGEAPLSGASAQRRPYTPPFPPPAGQTRYYGPFGNVFRAADGVLAFSPPWSSLVAYDLNDGSIKWQRPIGTTPGLASKGITNTGSSEFIRNGPVVTAGGLIFQATGPDRYIHALDKDTGRTLWETKIDANPDGIPAVYMVGDREYVAFFAAGGGTSSMVLDPGKPESQGYYVFALPKGSAKNVRAAVGMLKGSQ